MNSSEPDSESGVSPVIGVILMVAIVVALVALTTVVVFNISDKNTDTIISDGLSVQATAQDGVFTVSVLSADENTDISIIESGYQRAHETNVQPGDTIEVPAYEDDRFIVTTGRTGQSDTVIATHTVQSNTQGSISEPLKQSPSSCEESRYDGSGTETDPYKITNAHDLQCISSNLDAHYELTQNIDAYGTKEWNDGTGFEMIGRYYDPYKFEGSLDGNNYSIEGLTIDRDDRSAIFRTFDAPGNSISNLQLRKVDIRGTSWGTATLAADLYNGTIRNVDITGKVYGERYRIGGLLGRVGQGNNNDVLIEDINVEMNVTAVDGTVGALMGQLKDGVTVRNITVENTDITAYEPGQYGGYDSEVGGLTGEIRGGSEGLEISNVELSSINIIGTDSLGGMVGILNGGGPTIIENVDIESSTIESDEDKDDDTGDRYVGGLVGDMREGELINSSVSGMYISGGEDTGGAIGRTTDGIDGLVQNISVDSSTEVISDDRGAGGVFGSHDGGLADNVSSSADVTGTRRIGGIAGSMQSDASITRSVSKATLDSNGSVGGIVGQNRGSINKSYAIATVHTDSTNSFSEGAGGIVGDHRGSIDNVYSASTVTGDTKGGLVGIQNTGEGTNESYWDTSVSSINNAIGDNQGGTSNNLDGLTTTEMQGSSAETNMDQLDFVNVWTVINGEYPELQEE